MSSAPVNDAPAETKLSLYEASTQCKNWRYSVERLAHIRFTLNEAAVAVIRTKIESDEVFARHLPLVQSYHINVYSSQVLLPTSPS